MLKEKIDYKKLNSRQQEIYNFQKVSAVFADLGYTTIKLSDDWMGADFIAISFDGTQYLRVQLKSRLTFQKKYTRENKDLLVCFFDQNSKNWYLYNHDEMLESFLPDIGSSTSWKKHGSYSFPSLSKKAKVTLEICILG